MKQQQENGIKAVVVLSGGQDSATCLALACRKYGADKVAGITFTYGQRHALEAQYAQRLAEDVFHIGRWMKVSLDFYEHLTDNALMDPKREIHQDPGAKCPNTVVEGRNAIFLQLAAVWAKKLGATVLYTGVSEADFSGYPDCREQFIKAQQRAIRLALDYPIRIVTPFMHMSKAEEWALADELGATTCVNIVGTRCPDNWYGPDAGNYRRDFFAQAVDTARGVLDAVRPTRTALSFEMMPYGFLDSPAQYAAFLAAIDRPQVGVHYDPCNTVNSPRRYYRNGALIREMFRTLGGRILTVHVKDIVLDTAPTTVQLREVPVGEGGLDYTALIRCVRRCDPDLPLILEHLPDEAAYARAAAAFRKRWDAV